MTKVFQFPRLETCSLGHIGWCAYPTLPPFRRGDWACRHQDMLCVLLELGREAKKPQICRNFVLLCASHQLQWGPCRTDWRFPHRSAVELLVYTTNLINTLLPPLSLTTAQPPGFMHKNQKKAHQLVSPVCAWAQAPLRDPTLEETWLSSTVLSRLSESHARCCSYTFFSQQHCWSACLSRIYPANPGSTLPSLLCWASQFQLSFHVKLL